MSDAPTAQAQGSDLFNYLCLVSLSACLGSTFWLQSIALQDMSPLTAGALRLTFCAFALVPAAIIAGQKLPRSRVMWGWAGFNGLVGFFLPFNLTIWAQQYIETSIAAVIYSVIPLLVLAMSRLLLGVHITARKWLGLMLGTIGLVVLALPEDASSGSGIQLLDGSLFAKLVVLASAMMLAMSSVAMRKMPPTQPLAAMAAASIVGALLSLPVLAFSLPAASGIHPVSLAAIAAAGIFSTALGQTLRFFLVRRRGPVFIAPNAYLAAFFATVLGIALLGEPISFTLVIGFCVILFGLIIAQDGTGKMTQI
ncbi:MAG: DMT family transporter [Rhizobiaceae bacterium]